MLSWLARCIFLKSVKSGSVSASLRRRYAPITSFAIVVGGSLVGSVYSAAQHVDLADATTEKDWPIYGRTHDEQHYSPLQQLNESNVGALKLSWFVDLPASVSAVAAPIAVDGILYVASGLSVVRAVDARKGRVLWTYDPDVPAFGAEDTMKEAWGIRGLTYWNGKVYVGTQDGRLIALEASNGKPRWIVKTTLPGDGLYITGAPRVFKGSVIIGNGGGDHVAARGYVTAYDANTGKQRWRFYTVPGDPAKGFENDAMAMAAKTWNGEWWRYGGGGTAWNAMAYDSELNRIYIGTGNGTPWNQQIRSPGGGDNLFLCSIVALDADTGAYIWHYQTNPGESWDYNSAMDIQLATISIAGKARPVLLHAPKNGFFYVIDRNTGKLISAEPYTFVNWASRIDLQTGRPVETPTARFAEGTALLFPGAMGAHSWQPMSFSPKTGLVYIPRTELPFLYDSRGVDPKAWRFTSDIALNNGFADPDFEVLRVAQAGKVAPPLEPGATAQESSAAPGSLLAWNPVTQKAAWSVPLKGPLNGGVISTAGNLVFQGRADGDFLAYEASTGKVLWRFFTQNGVLSEPITYLVRGKQQVTLVTGFGGPAANMTPHGWDYRTQRRRILTFSLDGRAELPRFERPPAEPVVDDSKIVIDAARARNGASLYQGRCFYCHGLAAVAGGSAPDLRKSRVPLIAAAFDQVVRDGSLAKNGMPRFGQLTETELEDIRQYIRREARAAQ